MVYELQVFKNKDRFIREKNIGLIAFETDEELKERGFKFSGRLIAALDLEEKTFTVPDGIETLCSDMFVSEHWGVYSSEVERLVIPASVKTIEEGAFKGTHIKEVVIHPDSTCGVVENGALYTADKKTLLWIMYEEDQDEFIVPQGVKRVGTWCFDVNTVKYLGMFSDVEEIGMDGDFMCIDDVAIYAPKDSYGHKFAEEYGMPYAEVTEAFLLGEEPYESNEK
jgi:hypothetical protein